MTDDENSKTGLIPETAETASEEQPQAAAGDAKKKRHRIVWLGSLGALVLAAVVVGIVIGTTPATTTIEDPAVPLSSGASFGGATASGSVKPDAPGGTTASSSASNVSNTGSSSSTSPSGTTGTGTQGGNTGSGSQGGSSGSTGSGSSNSGSSGGGSNPGLTWHPAWDEQVWVDTSGYQSVYVGENPIYEYHDICNTCGVIVDGFGAEHIMDTHHSGYHSEYVLVGSTPLYENQWVSSGYWTTVTHPGYWA